MTDKQEPTGAGNVESTQTPTRPESWTTFIQPFADGIGSTVEEVTTALTGLVGDPGDEAIESLKNEEFTPFDDIKAVLPNVPTARLRMAVSKHLRATPEATEPSPAQATVATTSFDLLPAVPDDESWVQSLRTGGELKVDSATVISAIRAALASRTGLYDLPNTLVKMMEQHAEELEEPVGNDFFKLRKLLTKRSYAEIFAALDIEGSFVTERRKQNFLERLDDVVWKALLSFQGQVKEWTDAWQASFSNPGMMMGAFAALAGGGTMPAGMMDPPATDGLRDAAEGVNDQLNKAFAGVGVPIARALAYDAQRVKDVLDNPNLPQQIGAANREQMLKRLRVDVSADYVRLERNITRYALGVMEYPRVTSGQEDLAYLQSLLMLGSQIPWDRLGTPPRKSSASRRTRNVDRFDDVE